jgi:hypothetical protein
MSEIRINKVHNFQPTQVAKTAPKEEEKQNLEVKQQANQKDPAEVLDYMANAGTLNKANIKKTGQIDTTKYVDSESQARIEKMMKAFDQTILKSAETAINEFGLSPMAAQEAAIVAFNQKYLV